jgi:membrane fusion protein, copper/silver efflux system
MRGMVILGAAWLATAAALAAGVDLKPIVDPYVRIQRALNADSLDGVKDEARRIASEAARLGASGEAIQAAAAEFQAAADLKTTRAAMGKLGDAIMIYAKQHEVSLGDDVKVAYCPMLRKHWLQKGETIQNPFYGKAMPDCGRIVPAIPNLKK